MKISTPSLGSMLKGIALAVALIGGGNALSAQTFLHDGVVYKASGNKLTAQSLTTKTKPKPENGTCPDEYKGDIKIPATIEYNGKTYIVDALGTAFKRQPITSIEIADGVKTIGQGGFQEDTLLVSVKLPNTLTKLEANIFSKCSALKEISIPATCPMVTNSQFLGCTSLEKVIFEDGTEPLQIKAQAFLDGGNAALKEVYFGRPLDVTADAAMADKAFRGAPALEKVTFGPNVSSIGASMFENTASLKTVEFKGTFRSFGTTAFAGTGLESFIMPDSVLTVPANCFANCKSLKKVTLSAATVGIDALAFKGSALSEIVLPNTITYISDQAFQNTKLSGALVLPTELKKLGDHAFAANEGLTSVTFGAKVASIGDGAFMKCLNIASYEISADNENFLTDATKTYVTDKAGEILKLFAPKGEVTVINLPKIKEIAPYACYGATKLLGVYLENCLEYGDYCVAGTGIKELGVRGRVGRYIAQNCPDLTYLQISLKEAPIGIVNGCPKVNKVSMPDNITVIKQDAFRNTPALKSLNLGKILAIIEAGAFTDCGVENLTIAATYPPVMPEGVFTDAHANVTVTVPADLVNTYKEAAGWNKLKVAGDANIAAAGADMGMPAGLYYAGTDGLLHCVYADGQNDSYDVGGIPHTFQLLEFKNRIYGACAGKKFVYSATGATDGDGKLFYISKVGGETFQAVVLDNAGGNAYKDPFGLYIFDGTLYVNDRNVCVRKIPAEGIALDINYPSWMENNWMAYYGTVWSYGCIKSGFAITKEAETGAPLYWLGMKYNGEGIFRFTEENIGTGGGDTEKGKASKYANILSGLSPIFTTFNVDEKNGHLYIYAEIIGKAENNTAPAGLYRINLSDLDKNPNPDSFAELNPVLVDGAPVFWEGSATNEHVGISQFAYDEKGEYMYWCYRAPTEAQVTENEGQSFATSLTNGKYKWAEKYDAANPLHQSGIKRLKLGEATPKVEMVAPGVEGYGVVPVKYEGSVKPESGVLNVATQQAELIGIAAGTVVADVPVVLDIYNAAGMLVGRTALAAGESYTPALEAGVYVVVAKSNGVQQTLKLAL